MVVSNTYWWEKNQAFDFRDNPAYKNRMGVSTYNFHARYMYTYRYVFSTLFQIMPQLIFRLKFIWLTVRHERNWAMWDIENFRHSCKHGWVVVEYHAPSQWTIWKYHYNLYWIFLHPVSFWRELLIRGNERNQYEFPSSMKGSTDLRQSKQFFSSHIQCKFHNILQPPFSVVIFLFVWSLCILATFFWSECDIN